MQIRSEQCEIQRAPSGPCNISTERYPDEDFEFYSAVDVDHVTFWESEIIQCFLEIMDRYLSRLAARLSI